jgi:hypothetical protein
MRRATCNLLIVPPSAQPRQEAVRENVQAGADWKFVSDEVSA